MFLTTLLSDAAAQHGHEFSCPRPTTPVRLSPIPRAIRPQSAVARTRPVVVTSDLGKQASTGERARIEKVMFKEEAEVKLVDNMRRSLEDSSEEESQRPSMETTVTGEPIEALSAGRRKAKKEQRSRTAYTFAHTAARVNALHKLKSRPPAVLQLQKVAAGSRPKPAFEVYPSGRYAKKLGRELSRLHKGKDKLGADDVVLCKAHEYDAQEEDWESQDVVGIVCASCKDESHASGNAQLCLEDGSTWEAIPQPRGRYDFVSTDEHGISRVVRWVPRRVRSKQRTPVNTPTSPTAGLSPVEEMVYRFSTIDPRTRRHPVIATMTPTDLEISDAYYMPRKLAQETTFEDSTIITPDGEDDKELVDESDRELINTAPLLRSLILLSGIYVALRNSWSPAFSYKKDGGKANDYSAVPRSPNTSPAPSVDRVPFGTTRRHTFNFHRRSSTAATMSGTSMSTALSGGFSENSTTENSLPSRSTTPESRRRRSTLLTGLMRSATDHFSDKARQISNATESGNSTTAEGSEYSLPGTVRSPTPSQRLGAIDAGAEEQSPERKGLPSSSGGFFQRASSLRKHWRMPSNPSNDPEYINEEPAETISTASPVTTQPIEDVQYTTHRRRFSFSRGRARQRPDKTLSMIDNRPPAAYHNQQWWIDWGAEKLGSRPSSVVLEESRAVAGAQPDRISSPARPETAQRRSFSIQSWRRKDPVERPKSVFVTTPMASDKLSQLDQTSALQSVALVDIQRRDNAGFGGLMRRVTHRLRREERKLG